MIAKKLLLEITVKCTMAEWNQYQQNKNEDNNIAPYASTALTPGGLGTVVFEHVVPHSKAHWRAKMSVTGSSLTLIGDFGKTQHIDVYFLRGASDWGGSSRALDRTCLAAVQVLADLSPG